jgi:hypothetical protein
MLKTRVRPGLAVSRDRAIEEEDERYNPIRPSNGNMVMRGGSDLSMSSRNPRFSMAAARAGDIQTRRLTPGTGATPTMGLSMYRGGAHVAGDDEDERERVSEDDPENPLVDILHSLSKDNLVVFIKAAKKQRGGWGEPRGWLKKSSQRTVRDYALDIAADVFKNKESAVKALAKRFGKLKGGAAVPTMGLSEFRGGANPLLDHTNVARSGAYEGQGRSRKSMPPVAMRGGKYHRDGHALSEHMLATMGAAAHKKLMGGMIQHAYGCHGGAWWDFLDPNKNGVAAAFQDFGAKAKNEFVNPESVLRGKVLPVAAKVGSVLAPVINAAGTAVGVPGVGTAISTGLNAAQGVNQEAKNFGYGRGGKKKRAPASAGDGRRKRADIVRKVMKERGVKMIEASKIVKSEGLY